MVKLKRTTEYGLIALRHIGRKNQENPEGVVSAREIADHYGLPFEITAKTLQRLRDSGLIHSAQGVHGGYALSRSLEQVTLAEFLEAMEGPQALVLCAPLAQGVGEANLSEEAEGGCEYSCRCEVKGFMADLNQKVMGFLSGIRLADLRGEGKSFL